MTVASRTNSVKNRPRRTWSKSATCRSKKTNTIYMTDFGGSAVSVIDSKTNSVVEDIREDLEYPHGVVVNARFELVISII